MNKTKQRIVIAQELGYKRRRQYFHNYDGSLKWRIQWISPSGNELDGLEPPDYLNNLNACHYMELSLTHTPERSTWNIYREILCGMIGIGWGFASAAQRCEAFLKTFAKWEGGDDDAKQ